ncbi:transposase, partial [Patescibacteria group bacterium]|nr:transposase [Patescibacteria group bacterium]
ERDWARFLFLILYFQSPVILFNLSTYVSHFIKHRVFNVSNRTVKKIVDGRYVELVAFTLMPNHFHLILLESREGGISQYMQRVLNAYTKYYNAKYKTSGHLFQGPFKLIHIENDPQLLYLSAYIHCNIRGVKKWRGKEHLFPYSSFQDYIKENRWGKLLKPDIVSDQLPNSEEYKLFVQKSGAKEKPKT